MSHTHDCPICGGYYDCDEDDCDIDDVCLECEIMLLKTEVKRLKTINTDLLEVLELVAQHMDRFNTEWDFLGDERGQSVGKIAEAISKAKGNS